MPEALSPPQSGSLVSRLRAWRQRHLLRERRAAEFFADSRKPDLGLPVADRRDVGAFASRLLSRRRWMITALLLLHALAAMLAWSYRSFWVRWWTPSQLAAPRRRLSMGWHSRSLASS